MALSPITTEVAGNSVSNNFNVNNELVSYRGFLHHWPSNPIADAGWSELVRQLEYKGEWAGRSVVTIDQYFPSSKRCSCCGFTMQKMPLDVRKWQCPECGAAHDRDINAARNIKAAGLAVLAHGEPVNPEPQHAAWVRLVEVGIPVLQDGEQSIAKDL